MTAAEVRAALGPETWARYQKITSIRNPFDLAVSMFHWREPEKGARVDEDFAVTRARFHDWLAKDLPDCDKGLLHIDGAFVADQVIRFETLTADVDRLYHQFDPGAGPIDVPHTKNIGRRRTHAVPEYFTEESIAMVLRLSGWVFDRFGYPDRPQEKARASAGQTT
jgi:hypothetical protein